MDQLEIFEWDLLFLVSVALFNPRKACLRCTLQINYACQRPLPNHLRCDFPVDGCLDGLDIVQILHQAPENIPVCEHGALRQLEFTGLLDLVTAPKLHPGEEGVSLEREGPPLEILVVELEQVVALDVLPLLHGLLHESKLRHMLAK